MKRLNPIKLKQMEDRLKFTEEEIPRLEQEIAEAEERLGVFASAEESQRVAAELEKLRSGPCGGGGGVGGAGFGVGGAAGLGLETEALSDIAGLFEGFSVIFEFPMTNRRQLLCNLSPCFRNKRWGTEYFLDRLLYEVSLPIAYD